MRGRLCLIGAGLLILTGCAGQADGARTKVPVPPVVQLPASAAGGACRLLDYATIEKVTGTRFDVSAASQHRTTSSCVVRSEEAERPELVLSVTETTAGTSVFGDEIMPDGGRRINGLGKAAYKLILAPGRNYGAGVELGWLTGKGQLVSLRYTFAAGQDREQAEGFTDRLLTLAKGLRLDRQRDT